MCQRSVEGWRASNLLEGTLFHRVAQLAPYKFQSHFAGRDALSKRGLAAASTGTQFHRTNEHLSFSEYSLSSEQGMYEGRLVLARSKIYRSSKVDALAPPEE